MTDNKNRVAVWDNYKFILILGVVLGHMLAVYDDIPNVKRVIFFIYSFHMPAFIFVSGLFSKKTVNQKRYDKIFSFLILFLLIKTVLFLLRVVISHKLIFSLTEINDISWYALSIFVYYLITVLLCQFKAKYVMIAAILFGCLSGCIDGIGTYLSLSRICAFYPFFLLGYYLKQETIIQFSRKKLIRVLSVIFLAVVVGVLVFKLDSVYWFLKILKGKVSYAKLGNYAYAGSFLRLGWYLYASLFSLAILSMIPNIYSFFTKAGSRTMQIYAFHYIPMRIFYNFFNGKKMVQKLWPSHFLILIIILSILFTLVLAIEPITKLTNVIIHPFKQREN